MKKKDRSSKGNDKFKILEAPNEPLINYRGIKFSSKTDIIVYDDQNFVNDYMKCI